MRSVLIAITMLAALLYVVWSREARADSTSVFAPIIAQTPNWNGWVKTGQRASETGVPAWAKAYHTCGTFGATDDDCDPSKHGDLYAFCDAELTDPCDTLHLMVKDVCAETIRELTDGSARFSCALADAATRDAYLASLEPDKLANTFRAWGEGR